MTDDKTRARLPTVREPPSAELEPGLLVLHGPHAGTIHRLERTQTVVGRADEADLQIVADGVSRRHAELVLSADGTVDVFDLGSTNGVFVNGTKVDRGVLQIGDVLELGPVVRLRLVDAAASTQRTGFDDAGVLGVTDSEPG